MAPIIKAMPYISRFALLTCFFLQAYGARFRGANGRDEPQESHSPAPAPAEAPAPGPGPAFTSLPDQQWPEAPELSEKDLDANQMLVAKMPPVPEEIPEPDPPPPVPPPEPMAPPQAPKEGSLVGPPPAMNFAAVVPASDDPFGNLPAAPPMQMQVDGPILPPNTPAPIEAPPGSTWPPGWYTKVQDEQEKKNYFVLKKKTVDQSSKYLGESIASGECAEYCSSCCPSMTCTCGVNDGDGSQMAHCSGQPAVALLQGNWWKQAPPAPAGPAPGPGMIAAAPTPAPVLATTTPYPPAPTTTLLPPYLPAGAVAPTLPPQPPCMRWKLVYPTTPFPPTPPPPVVEGVPPGAEAEDEEEDAEDDDGIPGPGPAPGPADVTPQAPAPAPAAAAVAGGTTPMPGVPGAPGAAAEAAAAANPAAKELLDRLKAIESMLYTTTPPPMAPAPAPALAKSNATAAAPPAAQVASVPAPAPPAPAPHRRHSRREKRYQRMMTAAHAATAASQAAAAANASSMAAQAAAKSAAMATNSSERVAQVTNGLTEVIKGLVEKVNKISAAAVGMRTIVKANEEEAALQNLKSVTEILATAEVFEAAKKRAIAAGVKEDTVAAFEKKRQEMQAQAKEKKEALADLQAKMNGATSSQELEAAMTRAAAAGVEGSLMTQAEKKHKELVEKEKERAAASADLKTAMGTSSRQDLDAAVKRATAAGVAAEDVTAAEAKLKELEEKEKLAALTDLKMATLITSSAADFEAAKAKAVAAGVASEDVAEAEKERKENEAKAKEKVDALANLSRATPITVSKEEFEAATKRAVAAGVESDVIADAMLKRREEEVKEATSGNGDTL
eukprot:gnl/TRDRNA2_/TRDRNA2_84187_c0_seq3.p1 gnl/TRDRNA2_/TRDRNA2_84187_c0~~gnl/TRDRNA2_/TRDRNA2_84187_c0_seq3.p1  ORF type:complete len:841 (+),score=244.97 gnl/TRDRNA2_/TRDRNA2_84187_c0_seq3:79-2601(+)